MLFSRQTRQTNYSGNIPYGYRPLTNPNVQSAYKERRHFPRFSSRTKWVIAGLAIAAFVNREKVFENVPVAGATLATMCDSQSWCGVQPPGPVQVTSVAEFPSVSDPEEAVGGFARYTVTNIVVENPQNLGVQTMLEITDEENFADINIPVVDAEGAAARPATLAEMNLGIYVAAISSSPACLEDLSSIVDEALENTGSLIASTDGNLKIFEDGENRYRLAPYVADAVDDPNKPNIYVYYADPISGVAGEVGCTVL